MAQRIAPPLVALAILLPALSPAQVPAQIGYQGRLLKSDGSPEVGVVSMELSFCDAAAGGLCSAPQTLMVALSDGFYSLMLNAPAAGFTAARFLSIKVGGTQLLPLQPISPVPQALVADTALSLATALGEAAAKPAKSCADLLAARPGIASGVYWLQPTGARSSFRAYCDMVNEGGGWTLVWSNLRGGRAKPTTELQWYAAINTLPIVRGELSVDLESFNVYTGLAYWMPLAPSSKLRYDWAPDYRAAIDQRFTATFSFTGPNYIISMSGYLQPIGTVSAGWLTHNNLPFSALDKDNDRSPGNCAAGYSSTPWWYDACWAGSINGGGEFTGGGYPNGAYWSVATTTWGAVGGSGAGNGWAYVK